jgi:hypothetical protein
MATPPHHPSLESVNSRGTSDAASEPDSDLSSLDGFGDYARRLGSVAEEPAGEAEGGQLSSRSSASSPGEHLDDLP